MARARVTHERLTTVLSYDKASGVFRWKVRPSNRVKVGDVAGCVEHIAGRSYIQIRIDGRLYMAHQLAWFYLHREWVPVIDHRDLDGTNNREDNLRRATKAQNGFNRRRPSHNSSGFKGVTLYRPTKRWMARITANGKHYHLGYFATPEEAHAAYSLAADRLHGEFARAA